MRATIPLRSLRQLPATPRHTAGHSHRSAVIPGTRAAFCASSSPQFWSDPNVAPPTSTGVKIEGNSIVHKGNAIPGRWLRDNCACPECRNESTGQRRTDVFKSPIAGKIEKCHEHKPAKRYEVTFADGHRSVFPKAFFDTQPEAPKLRIGYVDPVLWQADIAEASPIVEHEDVQSGSGMGVLLRKIRESGFCFIDKMPAMPEATQSLLEQIGPIRNTHYGGFYDFTSDLSSKDTAYTSEHLDPHTDTTYFTEPIGLQALHLLSHTDGVGGLSSLVDGFAAAARLKSEDAEAYDTLCTVGVHAHASGNEGISIQPANPSPVLSTWSAYTRFMNNKSHKASRKEGILQQVRWNTADRAGIDARDWKGVEAWYDAAAKFDAILSDKSMQYLSQLVPGRMLIFDNWRVLHGRSAFTGKRRMCGGYINRDDFISKYRMTNLSAEEIKHSTITG